MLIVDVLQSASQAFLALVDLSLMQQVLRKRAKEI